MYYMFENDLLYWSQVVVNGYKTVFGMILVQRIFC